MITYGITVCNEYIELNSLLLTLYPYIKRTDEILILIDENNTNNDVTNIISNFIRDNPTSSFEQVKVIRESFNSNFADFKNIINFRASNNYIFQIDADEIPNSLLLSDIHNIIQTGIDLFYVSRENKVEGITDEYIKRWNWVVDSENRINYPDYQGRIFSKNTKWVGKVHEQISGYNSYTHLPEYYYLKHDKTIQKQVTQNQLYESIRYN